MNTEEKDKLINNDDVASQVTPVGTTPPPVQDTNPAPGKTDPEGSDLTATVEEPSGETPKVENLLEAVASIFPDYDLTNENLNGWVVEALKQYRNADSRIDEVLQSNPEFAEILKRVYEGEDAITAMTGVITPEEYADMVANSGGKTKEALEGRVKHLKELREWEETRTNNIGISEQTVQQYQAESGKTDEEMMSILNTMNEINAALNDGKITKRELSLIDKLINADTNAQVAAQAAAVAARNEKIDAQKASDFRPSGDGLPPVNSGAGSSNNDPLADTFLGTVGQKSSIWNKK
jgi:hypothetical protein